MSTRLALILFAACSHEAAREPSRGSEREPCRAGSACDPGLTCLSERCVRVPDVHCGPVVEALVSIELGNYAEPEERAAKAAELRPLCEAQPLTDSDAACIVAARTRDQLAQCPHPILKAPAQLIGSGPPSISGLPADCIAYVAVLDRYAACPKLQPDVRSAISGTLVQLKQNWAQLGSAALPPEVGDACRQGMQAMQQAMAQLGC